MTLSKENLDSILKTELHPIIKGGQLTDLYWKVYHAGIEGELENKEALDLLFLILKAIESVRED